MKSGMGLEIGNLFSKLPDGKSGEVIETLLHQPGLTIERITSNGQVTPEGDWYDQDNDEWVLLVEGNGVIFYEDESEDTLIKGDYLLIPKHKKHRVIHTDANTLWLAIHIAGT